MKLLVATHSLKQAGGTETFTYTLIGELLRQKHDVEYFCLEGGSFSARIEKDFGISFKSKKRYDLILANHHTTVKELHKYGLTIQTCHGIFPQLEQPSVNAHGYVSISQEVQNHLLGKGYPSKIIYNGIDCDRFYPKLHVRNKNPRVLSLCHSPEAHTMVEKACNKIGLAFTKLDKFTDQKWNVEDIINENDLVVGLGRSAYEALACGRPVIFFDKRHYSEALGDGYFLDIITESIKNNCSGRAIAIHFDAEKLANEILKFNKKDGYIARNFAILSFNIQKTTNDYLHYAEIVRYLKNENSFKVKLFRKLKSKVPKQLTKFIKYFIK